MRYSILHSLALGLAGLDIATASVCKPRSSEPNPSSVESTIASETSAFAPSSASSATFASTTTDAVTTEDTTVTEVASTLEVTATESATSELSTTEAIIAETTATSGTIVESTTTEVTTAIPSSTALPLFRVFAQGGRTDGLPLLADRNGYAILLYDNSQGDFSDAFFAVDPVTNYLMLDNEQPICGYFGDDNGYANIVRCSTGPTSEEVKITCQVPEATDDYLTCSVPALVCGSECVPNGETWSTMYTAQWGADVRYSANIGSDSVDGADKTPLKVVFLT
ncbi:activator of stress 1 [Fusarium sporotrichioides]|uniref:Activator of stress 1 n=1 Tax=Fusarium sporotrichioides TaxID=5514 RepID=A0A395SCR8_FUSSP|nr:activator of stress 1 [Fusarium sporotrichioides]